ncbi:hypothetical protein VNI00_013983 [Paramarasmius palmivorus]|uniref:Uncharacterized protein n=1 Tax=Paramarasmius palmivorus TaxID=297713 RepID=A0AAW0BXC3_9AGAR
MFTLPTPDAFVVVQLDPVDSVSHFNSPELTEACRKLKNKKYLALVGLRDGLLWPDVPYYSYDFYFVHKGLKCKDESQQDIDPGMCVPVLPNTSHPLGRAPLRPGRPLPWNDCYVSPFFAVDARCRNVTLDEEPPVLFKVSIDDAVRFSGFVDQDRQDIADRSPSEQPTLPSRCCCTLEQSSDVEPVGDQWNPTDEMEEFRELEEIIDEFEEMDAEVMELAALKVSFDLTELDEVTDPAEFFEELKAFEKLKEELVTSRKRREIEDARKIDEEFFSKLTQPDVPSTTPVPMTARSKTLDTVPTPGTGLIGRVTQNVKSFMRFFYS